LIAPRARQRRMVVSSGDCHVNDVQPLIAEVLAAASAPCVTSGFQAEGVVLIHMLRTVAPRIPVIFLDTVHHFPETYAYRDALAANWGLNVITLRAEHPRPGLWQRDTTACCRRHKVTPLFAALRHHDVWLTGLRRQQSPSRAALSDVESFTLPTGEVLQKVSPLAAWSTRDVWEYARVHAIPLLPQYDRGYPSIGCEPCTSLPADPSNPRSGRWGGQKLECGIHVPSS
jgi:phosphoadenosine phosphosulfate reductase